MLSSASVFRSNNIGTATCAGGKGSVRVATSSSSTSYLYQRITGSASPKMPTTGSLSQKDIDLIKDWIDQGAADN